jgi:hypothetical protein
MLRNLLAFFFCFGALPQLVEGAASQLISGLPSSYSPGQPTAFDVRLPAIDNLGSYNIDLVLESTSGTAGIDFFFDLAATEPAAANYVFPMSSSFFDAIHVDSAMRHRLTLSDFDVLGANVVAGQNDRVATVVLRTAAGFNGPLRLFIDTPSLILDTPAVAPTPVANFDAVQSAAAGAADLFPVPEPASVVSMVIGVALTFACWRRSRALAG